MLELVRGLGTEHVLEERGRAGALTRRPSEPLVECGEDQDEAEELEVSSQPTGNEVAIAWGAFVTSARSVSKRGK